MKPPHAERPAYLDYHSTTPVDPRVAEVVMACMTQSFGNPNSVDHSFGAEAASLVANAKVDVAALIGAEPEGVHFTSGATESIQLALNHAASQVGNRQLRIAVSAVEHRAVLDAIASLETAGRASVFSIPVDSSARLSLQALEEVCADGVDLVCSMAANNEVGTVYPIAAIASIANRAGARTLVDGTQGAGRIEMRFTAWDLTYLCFSAHKMYGPKGVGALVTRPGVRVRVEHGTVSGTGTGTPNVPGIAGLGRAAQLRGLEMDSDEARTANLRDGLEERLTAALPRIIINGDQSNRLSGNLHISVPGVPNDVIVARLRRRVALSTGAACTSGAQTRSHVLRAMGLSDAAQVGALRIGLGKFTTEADIDLAARAIPDAIDTVTRELGLS